MKVLIENGNSNIWNSEFKVLEIIHAMFSDNEVVIDLNSEGPCCADIGLYNILDNICDKLSFSKTNITIKTANALEYHNKYNIKKTGLDHYLQIIRNDYPEKLHNNCLISDCQTFGIFVRRPSWERIWLSSVLWKKNSNKVFGTFHWDKNSEFHLTHTDITDLLRYSKNLNTIADAINFLKSTPYEVEPFSILSDYRYCDLLKFYKNFFVEVVCETYFSGNTFFPTEKTWRSIATKTPFIVYGPTEFLLNLKKLGFKTFEKWWSEEYDDYGHESRIEKILELTDELAKYSTDELHDMYKDMSGVLEHNFKVFNKLSNEDFKRVFK